MMKTSFLLLLSAAFSLNAYACEFKVGFEVWDPYQIKEGAKYGGLDVEAIEAVAKNMGCKAVIVENPWNRQLALNESGELDVVLGASKAADREKYADFTDDYRTEANALFVKKGAGADIKELSDLAKTKTRIGIIRGSNYGDEVEAMKAKFDASADLDELNLKKIAADRLDGFIVDQYTGAALIKSNKMTDKVEKHPVKFPVTKIYFMVSKKTKVPDLTNKLNTALKAVKADGTLNNIIAKYK